MRDDITVIYYTSNRENPVFEKRIQDALVKTVDGLPIVSVSQKPMELGRNICVGPHRANPINMLKQISSGLGAADTRFVVLAEADVLYPSSYFAFVPPRDDVFYYPEESYMLYDIGRYVRYYRCEVSCITNREHMKKVIADLFKVYRNHLGEKIAELTLQDTFRTDIPVVSIKTRNGMHYKHHGIDNPLRHKYYLMGWGPARQVWDDYMTGVE